MSGPGDGELELPPELLGGTERYAVYHCYSDSGELLYIGESGELGKRIASHAQKLWFTQVRGITLDWYADELDALNAERRAIHVEHPKYNKQHRRKTSAQIAKPRSGARRKPAPRRPAPVDGEATMRRALAILAAEPAISASELGRRLGLSDSRGRQIVRELSKTAPRGMDLSGAEAEPEASRE